MSVLLGRSHRSGGVAEQYVAIIDHLIYGCLAWPTPTRTIREHPKNSQKKPQNSALSAQSAKCHSTHRLTLTNL